MRVQYKINYRTPFGVGHEMINELFIAGQRLAHRQIYIDINDFKELNEPQFSFYS